MYLLLQLRVSELVLASCDWAVPDEGVPPAVPLVHVAVLKKVRDSTNIKHESCGIRQHVNFMHAKEKAAVAEKVSP